MKTNDRRHEDTALREALGRINEQKKGERLPEDFEQQIISRMERSKLARSWMKAAAVFVGVLLMSGIALAAWQSSKKNDNKTLSNEMQVESTLLPIEEKDSIMRFDNIQLDSVLTVVANYYGKTVEFRNETICHSHFLIEWNHEAPLSQFIELINNFEGIRITEENDTIFVE